MKTLTYLTAATLMTAAVFGQSGKGHNGTGSEVFQGQCIGCHGPDGRAQTETGKKVGAADLTSDSVQQETDSNLSKIVEDGKGKMPAFKGKLGDDEIKAVIAYVRELAKKQ
jgi:mono/diheme cytochrome c family protein